MPCKYKKKRKLKPVFRRGGPRRTTKPLNKLLNTAVGAAQVGVVAGVGFGLVRGVRDAF